MSRLPGISQAVRSAIVSPDSGVEQAHLEQAKIRAANVDNSGRHKPELCFDRSVSPIITVRPEMFRGKTGGLSDRPSRRISAYAGMFGSEIERGQKGCSRTLHRRRAV